MSKDDFFSKEKPQISQKNVCSLMHEQITFPWKTASVEYGFSPVCVCLWTSHVKQEIQISQGCGFLQ